MLNLWESLALASLALVGARALRIYFIRRMIRSDFDYGMQVVATDAVKRARRDFQLELDFSPDSIERLEEMLGRLHEAYLKTPLTEKELSLQSIRWGAYVGEVARRVQPGTWEAPKLSLSTNHPKRKNKNAPNCRGVLIFQFLFSNF